MRNPLSGNDQELLAMPSIASQMPVRFASGTCWEQFDGQCNAGEAVHDWNELKERKKS